MAVGMRVGGMLVGVGGRGVSVGGATVDVGGGKVGVGVSEGCGAQAVITNKIPHMARQKVLWRMTRPPLT
jgi:hypothetical protein